MRKTLMKAKARKALANTSQALREVFGRNAFSKSKTRFLTGKGQFEKKAREMRVQLQRHSDSNLIHIGRLSIPITTKQMALATRDIVQTAAFRKKLLKNPRAAAMLAERLKDTKEAAYFAQIAKEAAKRAEEKKLREIIATKKARGPEEKKQREIIAAKKKKGREIIAAIAARRRDNQRADRQWAAKRKKPH